MTTRAPKSSARISGGVFKRGKFLLGRWGVLGEKANPKRAYLDFDLGRCSPRLAGIHVTLRAIRNRAAWIRYDRTKKGWHIVIALRDALQPAETVALQACCGSDIRRETLNLMRVLAIRRKGASPFWRKRYNILYEFKLK